MHNITYVTSYQLREGRLSLHKRERIELWQDGFKLFDRKWHSVFTKHRNLGFASCATCETDDEAGFRAHMEVSYPRRKFDAIAKEALKELQDKIDADIKVMTNRDYIRVVNKYLILFL
jgi:hypothetical protein